MSLNEAGEKELTTGTVEKVITDEDGKMLLLVGNKTTELEDIVSVTD
jgi:hypothetical protein